jgi:hypothetical protein
MASPTKNNEWLYQRVDLSVDSTTTIGIPAVLGNIWIHTTISAHACPVLDGAVELFSIPSGATAGTAYTFLYGTVCQTSLIINPDDAATGILVVQYKPLN